MNRGSLGQRPSSYGPPQCGQHPQYQHEQHLQLHLQQSDSINSTSLLVLNGRKLNKVGMAVPQRFGSKIWKIRAGRKARTFLLLLVSFLVSISFLYTLIKEHQMDLAMQVPLGGIIRQRKSLEISSRYSTPKQSIVQPSNQNMLIAHVSDDEALALQVTNGQSHSFFQRSGAYMQGYQNDHNNSVKSATLGTSLPKDEGPHSLEGHVLAYSSISHNRSTIQSPSAFTVPPLPLGHPCQQFTLPPPPADKKRTGPRSCPVCYLPIEQAIEEMPTVPSDSFGLKNLTYVMEMVSSLADRGNGGSDFGGYPSSKQREDYFHIQESMHVHCGFVKGNRPGNGTGFNIDQDNLFDMEQCHGIVVASAIFGNYDELQQPKHVSENAKRSICFFMFVDEETESFLRKTAVSDNVMKVGQWRIVVVHNLPYSDARRNGKVPKLLLHRLFPNARFSLWLDGKLELVIDPYQILERFLWRSKDTFAISQHYRRFDVFDEAEANKAAGKYENSSIDAQVDFYRREGFARYSLSKLPITSDVPEGCVIIREHTPITNLFTCLWFNEVDRFTSRDQLSFAFVRDKIIRGINWRINMFLDCERRNFVVQGYHRDILEQRNFILASPISKVEPSRKSLVGAVQNKGVKNCRKKGSLRCRKRRKKSFNRRWANNDRGAAEFS